MRSSKPARLHSRSRQGYPHALTPARCTEKDSVEKASRGQYTNLTAHGASKGKMSCVE